MPNILKQIQDLGGFCWDRYITGSDFFNNLYINSYIDECAVNQINFNSQIGSIETGITGDFGGIKLFTDPRNNFYGQKLKTQDNNFSINLETFDLSGNLKIQNDFNKINFKTDTKESYLNLLDPNKENIFINTSDIPNDKLAKFRCVKFDPNETEETCIKILSTKEIILKCCGPGSQGLTGPGGSIGIGGPIAFAGGGGGIGLDGPISAAGGAAGIEGEIIHGIMGEIGIAGDGINGDAGISGPISQEIPSQGIIGLDGPISTAIASIGDIGEIGFSPKGIGGTLGSPNTTVNPEIFRGPKGLGGSISIIPSQPGQIGEQGSINLGPYFPINGGKGSNGLGGSKSIAPAEKGENGLKGGNNINPGSKGSNGPLGSLSPISPFLNVGALRAAVRTDIETIVYGITGFINPFNKNDTTNNPVYGTQPGGETPFIP